MNSLLPATDRTGRRRDGRRSCFTTLAALMILLAGMTSARATGIFDPAKVGAPGSGALAELSRPAGPGPFPAVVVMHGCDGVGPHYREWASRLAEWGYVALLVDSFHARGHRNICNHGRRIPPEARAEDAEQARAWLAAQDYVWPDRIGVIGFSHGGWSVLKAVLATPGATPFAAAVAFYPGCETPAAPLVTDTLILIGQADDWTPAARCLAWRDAVVRTGHTIDVVVYPGALHGFDADWPERRYAGHTVGRDPAAAAAAITATRDFLAARLGVH